MPNHSIPAAHADSGLIATMLLSALFWDSIGPRMTTQAGVRLLAAKTAEAEAPADTARTTAIMGAKAARRPPACAARRCIMSGLYSHAPRPHSSCAAPP